MRHPHRLVPATAALAIVAAVVAAPAAAHAHDAEHGCEIASGSLSWGIKESFRAYIGSAIANGSWEVSDGATYETPAFGWTGPAGTIDPETGLGQAAFTGTVTFTGHEGLLNLVLADPVVHFGEDGATLLLDVRSNDTTGALAVDEQDVVIATLPIDTATAGWAPGAEVSWAGVAPVVLTEEGAAGFGGFYEAGDELDPITLSITLSEECTTADAPVATPTAEPTATPVAEEEPASDAGVPGGVVAAIVGGAVAVAGGVTAAVVAVRRRRGAGS